MRTATKPQQLRTRRIKAKVAHSKDGEKEYVEREVALTGTEAEMNCIAARVAPMFAASVKFYVKEYELSLSDAEQRADETRLHIAASAKEKDFPKSELRWSHFSALAATDMQAALDLWEGVKQFAREELATGERTCEAVFPNSKPLERARHFAMREEMSEGWKPQNGIEHAMIDMLAVNFGLWLHWTREAQMYATTAMESSPDYGGAWKSPRISEAEATDRAFRLADGYNRAFLRTLRQLRDLRRYTPPVIVNNGGQINVGAQQVNIAESTA